MARNDPVPGCVRIHARISASNIVTKNIRSASLKCAIDTTEQRGFPVGPYNKFAVLSGSPCIHT